MEANVGMPNLHRPMARQNTRIHFRPGATGARRIPGGSKDLNSWQSSTPASEVVSDFHLQTRRKSLPRAKKIPYSNSLLRRVTAVGCSHGDRSRFRTHAEFKIADISINATDWWGVERMERILVSRQPIYSAEMAVLGYELLFRDSDIDHASFSDGDQATAEVILTPL